MTQRRWLRRAATTLTMVILAATFAQVQQAEAYCTCSGSIKTCEWASQCYSEGACLSGQKCRNCGWDPPGSCAGGGNGEPCGWTVPCYPDY